MVYRRIISSRGAVVGDVVGRTGVPRLGGVVVPPRMGVSNPCLLATVFRDRRGGVHSAGGCAHTRALPPTPDRVHRGRLSSVLADARANDHSHDHSPRHARDPPRQPESEWTRARTRNRGAPRADVSRPHDRAFARYSGMYTHPSPTFPPSPSLSLSPRQLSIRPHSLTPLPRIRTG